MKEPRIKLGVNVDHVATLRQARKDIDPDPIAAAQVARQAGADLIVCHLRRDRRHIQDADLLKLCRLKGETHVELSDDKKIVDGMVRLYELDGVFGIVGLGARKDVDVVALTKAYTRLGEVLGIDWAQQQVAGFTPADQWERLLQSGLMRDFEQLRIDFLARARGDNPEESVENWVDKNPKRIAQFREMVERAKRGGTATSSMLAQIASQARILLSR